MPCYIIGVVHIAFCKQKECPYPSGKCQQCRNNYKKLTLCAVKGLWGHIVFRRLGIGRYKGESGGRSGGRCHTGSDESYAADYMSGYEMTGGGSFADIFPAADESQ